MKKAKSALLPLLGGLFMCSVVFAGPDFSGTWRVNAAKSNEDNYPWGQPGHAPKPPGWKKGQPPLISGQITIEMAGNEMNLFADSAPPAIPLGLREFKFVLDGNPRTTEAGLMYKASWSGETLIIILSFPGMDAESFMERRFSISPDRKTLTMVTRWILNGKLYDVVHVLDRKK